MPMGRSALNRRKRNSRQCRGDCPQRHRHWRGLGTFPGLVAGSRWHEEDFDAMDFLKSIFSREAPASAPMSLPSGTFTMDRTGRIVTSTLSNVFPEKLALEI